MTRDDPRMTEFAALVKSMAFRFKHRVNGRYTFDELVQIGYIALWKAIERHDASKGMKFGVWAHRLVGQAFRQVAKRMHVTSRFPWQMMMPIDSEDGRGEEVIEGENADPGDAIDHYRECEELREAILALNDRQRLVLDRRYSLEQTNAEIAADLGISRQRVHEIEKNALRLLRQQMEEL